MNCLSGLCVRPSALSIVLTLTRERRAMSPTLPKVNNQMTSPTRRARGNLIQLQRYQREFPLPPLHGKTSTRESRNYYPSPSFLKPPTPSSIRPTEVTSKRPVSRHRTVVETKKLASAI